MSAILDSTREKVRTYLNAIYGDQAAQIVIELDDSFIIRSGSAAVHLSLAPMGEHDVSIKALAYVVQGARITPDLLLKLMRLNVRSPFGAFGLIFDDTIVFSHTIAGANLDKNELAKTLGTVAFVADETDDEIRAIVGGRRAVDADAAVMKDAMKLAPKLKAKPAAKTAPKKAAKRPAKKAPPKKAVKKVVAKAAPRKAVKKPVKKAPPKKVVKKAAPKNIAKKPAPKKIVKKPKR